MSKSLDRDQVGCSVGPDLGPDCLQRSSADKQTIAASGQRVIMTRQSNVYNKRFFTWHMVFILMEYMA